MTGGCCQHTRRIAADRAMRYLINSQLAGAYL